MFEYLNKSSTNRGIGDCCMSVRPVVSFWTLEGLICCPFSVAIVV